MGTVTFMVFEENDTMTVKAFVSHDGDTHSEGSVLFR